MTAAPCRRNGSPPDQAGGEGRPRGVRIVVNGVGRRVVAPGRIPPVDNHATRVVLRHVDDLRIGGHDLDDFFLDHDDLLGVALQIACRLRFAAECLDRFQHCALVSDNGLTERGCPVQVAAHALDDLGIVEQRLYCLVPFFVDREGRAGFSFFEITIRLYQLQGVCGGRQDDGDQVVRVECDAVDEFAEFSA